MNMRIDVCSEEERIESCSEGGILESGKVKNNTEVAVILNLVKRNLFKFIESNSLCIKKILDIDEMRDIDKSDSLDRYIDAVIFSAKIILSMLDKIDISAEEKREKSIVLIEECSKNILRLASKYDRNSDSLTGDLPYVEYTGKKLIRTVKKYSSDG